MWHHNMIIHDIKDDHVLHVSSQEPSMSSKYPPSWSPIPDTLLIKISKRKFQGIFLRVNKKINDIRNDHVFEVLRQEPSMSSKESKFILSLQRLWPPPHSVAGTLWDWNQMSETDRQKLSYCNWLTGNDRLMPIDWKWVTESRSEDLWSCLNSAYSECQLLDSPFLTHF